MDPTKGDICFFGCDKEGPLLTAGPERIKKIIQSSKERADTLHHDLQASFHKNPALTIKVHKTCVSNYTSKSHIKRHLKQSGSERSSSEPPPKRRASLAKFDFKQCCIICGDTCIPKDSKNPKRWRRIAQCRTIEIKQKILQTCNLRDDDVATMVRLRIQGAVSDLHAADTQYHHDCYTAFTARRNISFASSKSKANADLNPTEQAFQNVVFAILDEPNKLWNSVEVYDIYSRNLSNALDQEDTTFNENNFSQEQKNRPKRAQLVQMLESHFKEDLLVMRISGCASLLCLRDHVPENLKLVSATDSDPVSDVIKTIRREVGHKEKSETYDIGSFAWGRAIEDTSSTLLHLVSGLVSSGVVTKQSLSLSQSIQTMMNKTFNQTTLGLAIKLHHQFGSRELIDTLHSCGYVASYDEVLKQYSCLC